MGMNKESNQELSALVSLMKIIDGITELSKSEQLKTASLVPAYVIINYAMADILAELSKTTNHQGISEMYLCASKKLYEASNETTRKFALKWITAHTKFIF